MPHCACPIRSSLFAFLVVFLLMGDSRGAIFDAIAIPNGSLKDKLGLKGEGLTVKGPTIEPLGESNRAVRLEPRHRMEFIIDVPALPKSDGMDPKAWYGRLTLDALQVRGRPLVEIKVFVSGKRNALLTARVKLYGVDWPAGGRRIAKLIPAEKVTLDRHSKGAVSREWGGARRDAGASMPLIVGH